MIYADKCRLIDAERKYNPQWGSIFVCVVTQGSLLSSATLGYREYNCDAVVFIHCQHTETDGMFEKRCCLHIQSDGNAWRGAC